MSICNNCCPFSSLAWRLVVDYAQLTALFWFDFMQMSTVIIASRCTADETVTQHRKLVQDGHRVLQQCRNVTATAIRSPFPWQPLPSSYMLQNTISTRGRRPTSAFNRKIAKLTDFKQQRTYNMQSKLTCYHRHSLGGNLQAEVWTEFVTAIVVVSRDVTERSFTTQNQ